MIGTSETPFDLKFRLLNIPVRVHPAFWVIAALMGYHERDMPLTALWVACVFVSILVHEFGHALMARRFDGSPSVILWGLGGLCYSQGERTPRQRLAVVLAGPGAGFLLLLLVMLLTTVFCGITPLEHLRMMGHSVGLTRLPPAVGFKIGSTFHLGEQGAYLAVYAYAFMVWINLCWGLVNLLPIWPLDGGQAAQTLLSLYDRSQGQRWSHIVSLLTAGVLAVVAYSISDPPDWYLILFFGYFAAMNFQILHSIHQAQAMGMYRDDEWWRR